MRFAPTVDGIVVWQWQLQMRERERECEMLGERQRAADVYVKIWREANAIVYVQ